MAILRQTEAKSRVTVGTQHWPSTQLIDVTSCVKMWDTMIVGAEEFVNISSYQMLPVDKNSKSS